MSALDAFRLDGKVALVTGGSRGIGRAIADALRDAGAEVWVTSRTAEGAERAVRGTRLKGATCDVSDAAQVEALFERVGDVDVLVCAAGLSSAGRASEVSPGEMRRMHEIHVLGALACAQRAHASMKARGGGSILLVTSVWGLAGQPGTLPYGAAKAALAHSVKVLALEWARDGVRVNGLAPGFVETAMTAEVGEPVKEKLLSRVPLRRAAEPDEMAGPALLLCSPAGSYVTGHILVADGGERAR
ncbi:MAG: gluconate 5-dehydrogenase [Sandaracinus sp.]|nr:gluconate 5-dehydrogenase [Sandaracinus sp.]